MPKFDLSNLRFMPHPDIEGDAGFMTVHIQVASVVKSYRDSLFSFEWLHSDGRVREGAEMKEGPAAERARTEQMLNQAQELPQPVLGIGMMGNIEIGAERAVLLTLAAHGVQTMLVHIPVSQKKDFEKFIVKTSCQCESGNVLVYILLAIVLIAALSYTVSQTGRNGSVSSVSDGQASTMATEILTYANHVKTAAAKLKLRGCTDTQLNFDNSVVAGYTNAGAPADQSCDLFAQGGGTLTWVTPPTGMNDATPWFYTGAAVVHNDHGVYSTNVSDNADLVMFLFGLPQNICTKINEKLGVDGIPVDDGAYGTTTKFTGTYSADEDINGLAAASQPSPCTSPASPLNFCGRDAGCFKEEGGAERYVFFQMLIKR